MSRIVLPRRKLNRRFFLGGAGAMLTLPFLESLGPRPARAQDTPMRRMLCFYIPNGIHMAGWTPATTGAGYALTPILQPLVNVRDKLNVISGLDNEPAYPEQVGDHASGTGAFLTGVHVNKTEGSDIFAGISVDQVAAQTLGEVTPIPSMQLGIQGGSDAGGCDSGYSCAYSRNISWASPTQPLNKTTNPQVVFDQLFAGYDPEASAEELARRREYRRSVLDYVREDANSLRTKLGSRDRVKLDEYLNGVDELEQKIVKSAAGPQCVVPDEPLDNLSYPEHVQAMLDLMVVAFQCDATRVISFMLGNAGSNQSYGFIGVPGAHHQISHHQGDPQNLADLQTIDIWEVEQLAYLLERMDAVDDADGNTMLDNSVVYFSSEIEDGNSHAHRDLPVVLAGGAGGYFDTGRHVQFNGDPMSNLFITMLASVGVTVSSFGDDGTQALSGL